VGTCPRMDLALVQSGLYVTDPVKSRLDVDAKMIFLAEISKCHEEGKSGFCK